MLATSGKNFYDRRFVIKSELKIYLFLSANLMIWYFH